MIELSFAGDNKTRTLEKGFDKGSFRTHCTHEGCIRITCYQY